MDVSKLEYLHIDVWTPNETTLNLSPISASSGEKAFALSPLKLNEWNSFDIPLMAFTIQGLALNDIMHLKLVGSGKSIIYVDNIYFYKSNPNAVNNISAKTELQFYPNPTSDVLYLKSDFSIQSVRIFSLSGKLVLSENVQSKQTCLNVASLQSGKYVMLTQFENGEQSTQKFIKE